MCFAVDLIPSYLSYPFDIWWTYRVFPLIYPYRWGQNILDRCKDTFFFCLTANVFRQVDFGASNSIISEGVLVIYSRLQIVVDCLKNEDIIPFWFFSSLFMCLRFFLFAPDANDNVGILNKDCITMLENISVSLVNKAEIGFTYNVIWCLNNY